MYLRIIPTFAFLFRFVVIFHHFFRFFGIRWPIHLHSPALLPLVSAQSYGLNQQKHNVLKLNANREHKFWGVLHVPTWDLCGTGVFDTHTIQTEATNYRPINTSLHKFTWMIRYFKEIGWVHDWFFTQCISTKPWSWIKVWKATSYESIWYG